MTKTNNRIDNSSFGYYSSAPIIRFLAFIFNLLLKFDDAMAPPPHPPKKVTIIGSGNWGSAIARIVGFNAAVHSDEFEPRVLMWVYEEVFLLF